MTASTHKWLFPTLFNFPLVPVNLILYTLCGVDVHILCDVMRKKKYENLHTQAVNIKKLTLKERKNWRE